MGWEKQFLKGIVAAGAIFTLSTQFGLPNLMGAFFGIVALSLTMVPELFGGGVEGVRHIRRHDGNRDHGVVHRRYRESSPASRPNIAVNPYIDRTPAGSNASAVKHRRYVLE